MKKIILSLFAITIILVSCKKDELVAEMSTNENDIDFSEVIVIDKNDNVLTSKKDFLEDGTATVMEGYNELERKYILRFFTSIDELSNYALENEKYNVIYERIKMINEIHALGEVTGDLYLENPTEDNISEEMKKLLKSFYNQESGKTNGKAILFDGVSHNGQSLGLLGNPMFSFGSFRNKASSGLGLVIGNFLCSKRWFTGRYHFLLTSGIFTLDLMGFDNDAESGM